MFLMNAPPVLALQSAWEAFGRPGSCRGPGHFSEPEGVGPAAVSARVQMIISSLQSDRAARGRSQERTLHRGQRGREAQPSVSPTSAACGLATAADPEVGEKATDLSPSALDSDSDDSVDRDIEEAIQEYLKAKSGAAPPAGTDGDSRCMAEPLLTSAPPAPCPPKCSSGSGGVPGGLVGAHKAPRSASPVSVSSEDSFEQSIRAEIEQFLNEKRQQETPKQDTPADGKLEPGDSWPKSALRPCKELAGKAQRQDSVGACKEFVFRKPPRLAKATVQPRILRPKVTSRLESLGGQKPAASRPATPCRTAEAQSKGGAKRNMGPRRRGQGAQSTALVREESDTSSDDGIEEAIQLYQLEKRKEASGDPPGEEQPTPLAHCVSHTTKSALPETHRKTPGKKKPVALKAADLGPGGLDPDHPSKSTKETKAPALLGSAMAESEFAGQPLCRADTSAELMCAEAILDFSKAILPAPGAGGDRPPPASPPPGPLHVPSRSDGDSSAVDSDDSIEREIRTFLALKAQSGSLPARADTCPYPTRCPLPSPGPNGQAGGPKAAGSKTLDLPLSRKRKRRGGSSAMWSSTPKKTREVVKEGTPDPDLGQGKASEAPGREGEARGQLLPCQTAGAGEEHVAPDPRGSVSPSQRKAGEARGVDEKESSEDKSSSLDSDEDLDTAIKDLLRSKQRLRKRCRDPRAACRKKVRFNTTGTRALSQQGSFQRGWKDRSPHVLKSCLPKSKRDGREDPLGKHSSSILSSQTERAKPGGTGPTDSLPLVLSSGHRACQGCVCPSEAEAHRPPAPAASPGSPSEDSSSVDSDDSIELEIRKFLAQKAKESLSGLEIQGGGLTALGSGSMPRPEPLSRKVPAPAFQPGMCTRSQRGRGTPQPATGLRGGPRAEQACLPAALSRGQQVPPRSPSGPLSARGSPAGRRNPYPHKDQSLRGAGPAAADSASGQLSSCVDTGSGTGSPLPVNARSQGTLTRSPGADREGGPQAGLTLPWSDLTPQSRLQSTWALSSKGREAVWRGNLGSQREKVPEGPAQGVPSLTTDPKKGLPFAGFPPLLSTQLFHFGGSVSWGATPTGLFSPGLSRPLQGPSFSAFREAPAGNGPVFGSSRLLVKKEGGRWPRMKAPAALSFHDNRNSGSDEDLLDLRCGQRVGRDDEEQEAWGSDASGLSDTSLEDGSPAAPAEVLTL